MKWPYLRHIPKEEQRLEGDARALFLSQLFHRTLGFPQCTPEQCGWCVSLWPLNKRTKINPGLRKSFHLLLFRYVWMLCRWIPHQEKPGKHPDEVATTLKKLNRGEIPSNSFKHTCILVCSRPTRPIHFKPKIEVTCDMKDYVHTIQSNQGHQPASHPNQIRPNQTKPMLTTKWPVT